MKREEEVADETNGSPHHISVLFFTQLHRHKSSYAIHHFPSTFSPSFKNDCHWLQWSWGHSALLTNQVLPPQVLLRDMIKEGREGEHNTVKDKGLCRFQEDQSTMYFCISFTHHTDSSASQAVQAISTTYVHAIKRTAWESWGHDWPSNGEGWPFFHRGKKTKHYIRV